MFAKKLVCILIILSSSWLSWSQDGQLDSLKAVIDQLPNDTVKVNNLNQLTVGYFGLDLEEAIRYGHFSEDLAASIGYSEGRALALKNVGIAYYLQSDYFDALDYWKRSLA